MSARFFIINILMYPQSCSIKSISLLATNSGFINLWLNSNKILHAFHLISILESPNHCNTFESNAVQNRFTAYLITAIHRKKVDYWKKAEYVRAHELMVGTDEMFEDGEASYENVMNIGEGVRCEVLDDALKQLSVRERYVIFARVVDMRGFAEIGTKLGLGYQGAAAVYYRAIRKIKKFIVESEKGGEVSR